MNRKNAGILLNRARQMIASVETPPVDTRKWCVNQGFNAEQISRMALATVLKLQPGRAPKRLILESSFDAPLVACIRPV